ncbi:Retinitis pigmentosa 9 [Balamuthia mandrillaris]
MGRRKSSSQGREGEGREQRGRSSTAEEGRASSKTAAAEGGAFVRESGRVDILYEAPPGLIKEEEEERPEDSIPDKPENRAAREFLAKAPTKGLWMPLGKEVKVMQCWRCKSYGHRTGDRECPLRNSGNPVAEAERQARLDPMAQYLAEQSQQEQSYKESRILELKEILEQEKAKRREKKERRKRKHKKEKKKERKGKRRHRDSSSGSDSDASSDEDGHHHHRRRRRRTSRSPEKSRRQKGEKEGKEKHRHRH